MRIFWRVLYISGGRWGPAVFTVASTRGAWRSSTVGGVGVWMDECGWVCPPPICLYVLDTHRPEEHQGLLHARRFAPSIHTHITAHALTRTYSYNPTPYKSSTRTI